MQFVAVVHLIWKGTVAKMSDEVNSSIFHLSAFNFAVARLVGVVPLSVNHETFTVKKSKFWQISSVLIAGTFIICYPLVLRDVFTERKVQLSGIWQITEIIQYGTTYLLTAHIYIVNVFYTDEMIEYINNGFYYSFVYERRLQLTADERNPFLYQFMFRTIYSYLGFIYSNHIRLTYIYGRDSDIFMVIYCLPDIVIASAAIRFMTSIMMQLTYTRRLNEIARNSIRRANATSTLTQYEREKISCELSDTIDWLCEHHIRLESIARATERLLSNLLIFSTVYAFANLASCVSWCFEVCDRF